MDPLRRGPGRHFVISIEKEGDMPTNIGSFYDITGDSRSTEIMAHAARRGNVGPYNPASTAATSSTLDNDASWGSSSIGRVQLQVAG
jgi:hypothetical protein